MKTTFTHAKVICDSEDLTITFRGHSTPLLCGTITNIHNMVDSGLLPGFKLVWSSLDDFEIYGDNIQGLILCPDKESFNKIKSILKEAFDYANNRDWYSKESLLGILEDKYKEEK